MATKIIRLRIDHARIQMTNEQLKSVAARHAEAENLLYLDNQPEGIPILLFTGAKAYCRTGGWWDVMGSAFDGSDVQRVIDKLTPEAAAPEAGNP